MSRTSVLFSALRTLLLSNDSLSDSLILSDLFIFVHVGKEIFATVYASIGNERKELDCAFLENDA